MSRICEITGKKMMTGNNVSHSKRRTRRQFLPNIQVKRYYLPTEDKWVKLKVSTHGMRIIDKKGITKALQEAREQGHYTG